MTDTTPRLTAFSHGAGCGCKIGPDDLSTIMGRLAPVGHPDLLVGHATADDAAVWRLDADRALVLTTDFFTPIVDDARAWGRIAAANAASDVYAMGGRPLCALNLVCWNLDGLGHDLLTEVLAGAAEVAAEGGWIAVGGHTIDDPEPKFGQAVLGEVHPDRILTNGGARPGQALVLSKPLGTGVVATAAKTGSCPPDVLAAAVAQMTTLNLAAAEAAAAAGATAATDVTGFGLLGHLRRICQASGVAAVVDAAAVPVLTGVRELVVAGAVAGGTRRNAEWVAPLVDATDADEVTRWILADAQTSGGLLFTAEPGAAAEAAVRLTADGHRAAVIGRIVEGAPHITVR